MYFHTLIIDQRASMKTKFLPSIKTLSPNQDLYYIDLFYTEDNNEHVPKITFIAEDDKEIADLDDFGVSGSELVKQSFENLNDIEFSLDKKAFNNKYILSKINHPFASEKILDKGFLKAAAQQLDTTKIKVAIPVKDSILIADANDEEAIYFLNQEAHQLYNDFAKETLSRLIYEIENGVITSAEFKSLSYKELLESTPQATGSYQGSIDKSKLFGELYNVRLVAGAENFEDLQNGIFNSLQEIIKTNLNKENFNNTIEILLGSEFPPKNKVNIVRIRLFFKKLKSHPFIKGVAAKAKDPIKITFIFHEDFRNGNVHEKIIFLLN